MDASELREMGAQAYNDEGLSNPENYYFERAFETLASVVERLDGQEEARTLGVRDRLAWKQDRDERDRLKEEAEHWRQSHYEKMQERDEALEAKERAEAAVGRQADCAVDARQRRDAVEARLRKAEALMRRASYGCKSPEEMDEERGLMRAFLADEPPQEGEPEKPLSFCTPEEADAYLRCAPKDAPDLANRHFKRW